MEHELVTNVCLVLCLFFVVTTVATLSTLSRILSYLNRISRVLDLLGRDTVLFDCPFAVKDARMEFKNNKPIGKGSNV